MRVLAAAAALMLASGLALAGSWSAAASGGGTDRGGCDPYIDGTVIPIPCSSDDGSAGSGTGGSGGSTVNSTCVFGALDEPQAENFGVSWPPPKGEHWALMDCPGGTIGSGPDAVLVSNGTGAPRVTPPQLLVRVVGELKVPYLQPATAPPRGADGLVGLPEWFWVPGRQWHARTVTVTAGTVWATAIAAPVSLSVMPGAGLSPVRCPGPGVAYNRHEPAAGQHTNCAYTYLQPSAGQPGNIYWGSATVTWRISWTGSGGAGGVLDPALPMPVGFTIPVAQGEALVMSP